ncbi:ribosomal RNA-processing protein 7 homolog A [Anopheles ziemanni]|uniref:ribosomal RNA-processing protein 7 homolog A n=1 Tax=Anopheles coustani TaxID=139045 RepID=UPI00265837BC|nr:ribosomal RNA-processing protein 7 homolog A [Anopheles coustani]XP_058169177.1 ribosomal RNA-processing protein 7 homolog A [Anopheles ziemanni]
MSTNEDFTVIPLKFVESDESGHQLLVKENASKVTCKQKPIGRTLYVLNVPPYATKKSLQLAFSAAGNVERVALQERPSSKESASIDEMASNLFKFKVAYIVFEESASLKKLLKSKKINALNADGKLLTGVPKWIQTYKKRVPDPVALQKEIDEYMQSYDETMEQKKIEESAKNESEDGWVTISTKNSNAFSQKESVVKKLEKKLNNDSSTKELKNFYTFQIREAKKNDIISLRKKYDRDLQKMEQIKKTKRFKPY